MIYFLKDLFQVQGQMKWNSTLIPHSKSAENDAIISEQNLNIFYDLRKIA